MPYRRFIGWPSQYGAIVEELGFEIPPSSAIDFAEGVAAWQPRHGLVRDGMLGPQTWRQLRPRLSGSAPGVPVPGWLQQAPASEGWTAAIIETLGEDTGFLRLRHAGFDFEPRDFIGIADLRGRPEIS